MARIQQAAGLQDPLQNVFPQPVIATRAPTASDKRYAVGQVWINTSSNQAWFLTSVSSGSATWALSSPGASDVDTLTGDSGGAISPAGGNINLAGGTNITTAGAGSTITFNLDSAITLSTSVTSALYTTAAASDLLITSASGQDIVLKMGDAAGANKVSFTDSSDVEVFAVDSNGSLTFTGLTVTGAFAQTGGTFNVGQDNAANAINIGGGTTARAIGIGNSAAAHTLTIGSTTGAASLDLQYGTGNFTLDGGATGNVTVADAMTSGVLTIGGSSQTGNFVLGPSDGAMTANIVNGNGAKTINIGAGINGNTISVGNGINTSAQTINIANGASAADSTINVLSGVGTAGAGVLNLANNTRVTTVDIADIAPAAARTINIAGGNSAQNDTVNILTGAPSANTQTVNILSGTASGGTQALNLGTGATGVTVGIGASAGTVNVDGTTLINDSINQATSINTGTSTGAISIGNAAAGNITVASGGTCIADTAGNIEVNSSGGQILIGNDDVDQNASFATDGERTVTVGSTNGAAALVLQAGTGNITMTGTIEQVNAKEVNATGFDLTIKSSPLTCTAANTGGVATGSGGDINLLSFANGIIMEQFIIGTQTIIKPGMDANGLLISLDSTNTDGVEYNFGAARSLSEYMYTVGTSPAFYFEVTLTIADISGGNPYIIGFRKAQANQSTFTSYTDFYALGMYATTSATNITLMSELNGGGTTFQDSGDAWTGGDGGTATLRVNVSAAGVVTATIDGGAPSTPLAYTFDNADVVCPFIHIVHNADAGNIRMTQFATGFQ